MTRPGFFKAALFLFVELCLLSSSAVIAQNYSSTDYPRPIRDVKALLQERYEKLHGKSTYSVFDTETYLLQASYKTPAGHFIIHYDTTAAYLSPTVVDSNRGPVSLADADHNGVPDYVDSVGIYLEEGFKIYHDLGFTDPIGAFQGEVTREIHVHLTNLAAQHTYGMTYPVSNALPGHEHAGVIELDNDYSPNDTYFESGTNTWKRSFATTGFVAAKVSAVHELHHVIQFSYLKATDASGDLDGRFGVLQEMTSTSMESWVYPYIPEYSSYVTAMFENINSKSFAYPQGIDEYGWCIFLIYARQKYDIGFIKRVWELVRDADCPSVITVLDSAFIERGSSFTESWCDFLGYLYHTGEYAQKDPDGNPLRDSKGNLVDLLFADRYYLLYKNVPLRQFTEPSFTESCSLMPFGLRVLRFYGKSHESGKSNDTIVAVYTNSDYDAYKNAGWADVDFTFFAVSGEKDGFSRIGPTPYYYSIVSSAPHCSYVKNSGGLLISYSDNPYPNPFTAKDKYMSFPVPPTAVAGSRVNLVVYNTEMVVVGDLVLSVVPDEYAKKPVDAYPPGVVRWDVPDDISSGIYLYRTVYKDDEKFGKFAVIRKN